METNLFGRWPLKVQSMRLGWGNIADVPADIWLEVRGRLNLGLASLSSIGVTVRIIESGGRLEFDLQLDEIEIELSLAGTKISGRLGWGDTDPKQTKVPFTDIIQPKERDKDIRGALTVKTSGFLGDTDVSFRAGNKGELSHWVASVMFSGGQEFNLGFGKLKDPGFLIAQNADLGGELRRLALSPEGAIFRRLRPDGPTIWAWLNKWDPSADIGTVLAASGYFTTDDVIVKEPEEKDDKSLSGVLWIDSGVLTCPLRSGPLVK